MFVAISRRHCVRPEPQAALRAAVPRGVTRPPDWTPSVRGAPNSAEISIPQMRAQAIPADRTFPAAKRIVYDPSTLALQRVSRRRGHGHGWTLWLRFGGARERHTHQRACHDEHAGAGRSILSMRREWTDRRTGRCVHARSRDITGAVNVPSAHALARTPPERPPKRLHRRCASSTQASRSRPPWSRRLRQPTLSFCR
jgi:hypothetical protein